VETFDGKPFTEIYGHKLLAGPLKMALRLVCERGLAEELKTYDGCFNIRPMKASGSLSVHSWGLALDFNQATNPFQDKNARTWPDLITDFSDDFVKCFAEAGFEWGGLWNSIHDAMHFQLPWTQDWRESSKSLRPAVYAQEEPAAEEDAAEISQVSGTFDFSTKDGTIAAIKTECQKQGIGLSEQIAYVLATVEWETAHTFKPVREAYWKDEEWRRRNLSRYYPYYGRGYVQLTWKDNYRKYSEILGIDLVKDPDLAMEPPTALFILVHGFKTGTFTGKKISDYINSQETDFINARRCINVLDKAEEIAALAEKFLESC
jgi:predicted chitinase